jgi:hypothetical protein
VTQHLLNRDYVVCRSKWLPSCPDAAAYYFLELQRRIGDVGVQHERMLVMNDAIVAAIDSSRPRHPNKEEAQETGLLSLSRGDGFPK